MGHIINGVPHELPYAECHICLIEELQEEIRVRDDRIQELEQQMLQIYELTGKMLMDAGDFGHAK